MYTSDTIPDLDSAAADTNFAVIGTVAHSRVHEFVFGDPATELSDRLQASVLLAHPREDHRRDGEVEATDPQRDRTQQYRGCHAGGSAEQGLQEIEPESGDNTGKHRTPADAAHHTGPA